MTKEKRREEKRRGEKSFKEMVEVNKGCLC